MTYGKNYGVHIQNEERDTNVMITNERKFHPLTISNLALKGQFFLIHRLFESDVLGKMRMTYPIVSQRDLAQNLEILSNKTNCYTHEIA
jgi:hypothetical protein